MSTENVNTTNATPAPAADPAEGRCPVTCDGLRPQMYCGCGEGHPLSTQRQGVVHHKGGHWNAACGFMDVIAPPAEAATAQPEAKTPRGGQKGAGAEAASDVKS